MSAPTKWHMLRVTTTEKKLVNVVLHEDKWCKYPWQAPLTLCLWIQPWLREAVDPCWLSGGHLGSKHLAGLAGCILGLAACLTHHFSVLNTERGRAKKKEKKKTQARICWDRSRKFGIGAMFDQDIKGLVKHVWWRYTGFPHIQYTLSSLISCVVLPQLSVWLRWWETHKIQSTHTHTQPRYNWYTHPDNPSIWLPVSLFSCFTLSLSHRHNPDTMTWAAVWWVSSLRYEERPVRKGSMCVCIHPYERERREDGNKRKKGRWGEKTERASIAK